MDIKKVEEDYDDLYNDLPFQLAIPKTLLACHTASNQEKQSNQLNQIVNLEKKRGSTFSLAPSFLSSPPLEPAEKHESNDDPVSVDIPQRRKKRRNKKKKANFSDLQRIFKDHKEDTDIDAGTLRRRRVMPPRRCKERTLFLNAIQMKLDNEYYNSTSSMPSPPCEAVDDGNKHTENPGLLEHRTPQTKPHQQKKRRRNNRQSKVTFHHSESREIEFIAAPAAIRQKDVGNNNDNDDDDLYNDLPYQLGRRGVKDHKEGKETNTGILRRRRVMPPRQCKERTSPVFLSSPSPSLELAEKDDLNDDPVLVLFLKGRKERRINKKNASFFFLDHIHKEHDEDENRDFEYLSNNHFDIGILPGRRIMPPRQCKERSSSQSTIQINHDMTDGSCTDRDNSTSTVPTLPPTVPCETVDNGNQHTENPGLLEQRMLQKKPPMEGYHPPFGIL